MAFVSDLKHRALYSVPTDLEKNIADIRILLDGIRLLPIGAAIKKRILVQAIWEHAYATGNTQQAFLGRYRSEAVVNQVGLEIQRDHIYKKAALIRELLSESPNFDEILNRAHCCVVTVHEHRKLGLVDKAIDGWERYRVAGVTVFDMVDRAKVV